MDERDVTIYGRRKNGQEFPAAVSISKVIVAGRTILSAVLRDISDVKRNERNQRFFSELGAVLSSTLDYEETIASIAQLSVPFLADCCIVGLVNEEAEDVQRWHVAHADETKAH